jgi:hypothetical protein
MRFRRLAAPLLFALAALASGQEPAVPDAAPEIDRRRAAAAKAREAGDAGETRHHLLRALALDGADAAVLADLIALDAEDADARALWALHAALAGADASGRFNPPREWPKELAADAAFARDAAKRHGKAVKSVRTALAKVKGARGHASLRWLRGLGRELVHGAPGLGEGLEDAFAKAEARTEPNAKLVVDALLALTQKARTRDDLDTALQAARTIRGLHQQANQTETAGAVPTGAAERAVRLIAVIRRELREREEAALAAEESPAERLVWDVESLREVPQEEIDAWNERHSRWSAPGVALSPEERYRVETTCGLVTLLTVTADVELHHARLVRWFGQDPFEKRQGLVRLCPDYRDFEGEGQPFWWAGGFQAGDITTMIARFPTRGGLGGTLVHELNHRFDGAIYPGLPAWASEGRAVYVQVGSLRPDAEDVSEDVTAWGRFWETNSKGYGRPDGLRDLLRGDVADYRHNYDAGYTLFTFLRRFADFDPAQNGTPLFRSRIDAYLRSFREKPRKDPVARFESFFCDGEDGRPDTLEAFAERFRQFAAQGGSGAVPAAPWKQTWSTRAREAYIAANQGRRGDRPIYDRATFQPDRSRNDKPDHGQYHTLVAARLLLADGQKAPALEAIHWALRADEPDGAAFAAAAEQSRAAGDADLAWVELLLAHHHDPALHESPDGAPTGAVSGARRAAADVAKGYAEGANAALGGGRLRLARALRAEHDRIAHWLGREPMGELPADAAAKIDDAFPSSPELPPYASLFAGGVAEAHWAPLESEPGPWHQPLVDAVELGRTQQGAESSDTVRDAHERRVFVESPRWLQGAYSVRTRVRFLSAFATGELVLGKTHRDRGLRVTFGGGDWGYAVGNRDQGTPLTQISLGVSDLRPWGRRVAALRKAVAFPSPRDVFEIEVRVAGPYVSVLVDGEVQVCHRRPTGAPIEGRVGFGLSRGIVRFEEAASRRHRALGPEAAIPGARLDERLDPARRGTFPWATVTGRRVAGVPLSPRGAFVLFYPDDTPANLLEDQAVASYVENYLRWMRDLRDEVPVHLLVPASAVDADDDLVVLPQEVHENIASAARHAGHADVSEVLKTANQLPDGSVRYRGYPEVPLWLMLDHRGVIRSAAPWDPVGPALELVRALAGR